MYVYRRTVWVKECSVCGSVLEASNKAREKTRCKGCDSAFSTFKKILMRTGLSEKHVHYHLKNNRDLVFVYKQCMQAKKEIRHGCTDHSKRS